MAYPKISVSIDQSNFKSQILSLATSLMPLLEIILVLLGEGYIQQGILLKGDQGGKWVKGTESACGRTLGIMMIILSGSTQLRFRVLKIWWSKIFFIPDSREWDVEVIIEAF